MSGIYIDENWMIYEIEQGMVSYFQNLDGEKTYSESGFDGEKKKKDSQQHTLFEFFKGYYYMFKIILLFYYLNINNKKNSDKHMHEFGIKRTLLIFIILSKIANYITL